MFPDLSNWFNRRFCEGQAINALLNLKRYPGNTYFTSILAHEVKLLAEHYGETYGGIVWQNDYPEEREALKQLVAEHREACWRDAVDGDMEDWIDLRNTLESVRPTLG